MGFLCLLGGPIANRIGLNWTLLLGAIGYPLYSCVLSYLSLIFINPNDRVALRYIRIIAMYCPRNLCSRTVLILLGKCLVRSRGIGGLWIIVSARASIMWHCPKDIRAGLFWASEGAVALGYPEPSKRGRYMK